MVGRDAQAPNLGADRAPRSNRLAEMTLQESRTDDHRD
jgi:hypothetical protein